MKTFIPFFIFFLLCSFQIDSSHNSKNLIKNGDFERGSKGFETSYSVGKGGEWGKLSVPGTYSIVNNASHSHDHFAPCNDRTSGSGENMMVVNGSTTPNTSIWNQTISVKPKTVYRFEMWATVTIESTPAVLEVEFNGALSNSKFNVSALACNWKKYTIFWYSNENTTLKLSIQDSVLSDSGNDFAIDDIALYSTKDIFASTSSENDITESKD
jgi:hypothetical protein